MNHVRRARGHAGCRAAERLLRPRLLASRARHALPQALSLERARAYLPARHRRRISRSGAASLRVPRRRARPASASAAARCVRPRVRVLRQTVQSHRRDVSATRRRVDAGTRGRERIERLRYRSALFYRHVSLSPRLPVASLPRLRVVSPRSFRRRLKRDGFHRGGCNRSFSEGKDTRRHVAPIVQLVFPVRAGGNA